MAAVAADAEHSLPTMEFENVKLRTALRTPFRSRAVLVTASFGRKELGPLTGNLVAALDKGRAADSAISAPLALQPRPRRRRRRRTTDR